MTDIGYQNIIDRIKSMPMSIMPEELTTNEFEMWSRGYLTAFRDIVSLIEDLQKQNDRG